MQVLVLVAQHRGKFLGMESFTQAGLGAQKVTGEKYPWNAVVSFQEVLSKRVFHYVGPGVKISGTAGTQLDLSYGHGLNMSSLSSFIPSFSGNIQTFQKVDFNTTPKNPKSPIFSGTVEADQFVGFRDIGKHGGAISAPGWDGVSKMLSTSGLMLSQVNVTGGMTVPINSKISSRTQVGYQGTNIGQVAEITTGMNIQAASGVKVFAFVGYKNADLPGYMTQSSLIQQATGFESGARVVTPGGMNLSGKVEGLGGPSGPQADLTLGIPIQGKKKKKPPTTVVAP